MSQTQKGLTLLVLVIITAVILGGGYMAYKKIFSNPVGFDTQNECEQKTGTACRFECGGPIAKGSGGMTTGSCDFAKWVAVVLSKPAPLENKNDAVIKFSAPADWKTYRNEKYGFALDYPTTLSILPDAAFPENLDFTDAQGRALISVSLYNATNVGISFCGGYGNDSRCEVIGKFQVDWARASAHFVFDGGKIGIGV
ncbi:MAG: hypothetical protein COV91_06340 [Candidatus Taylorbacteria bacterium CG11_big_fil_rev_8_21_14_0_20_46_11]|uniref:Uncharacterized protein n=1 Tax=Candidatus Taylorbacteria bacterium CG11_big_fil_rev_8_21_14_0_20_46_11 TaxID=1975025 RepID=A0A2H0K9R7_9BACT|nr:MAG: hypothetical protein COV91_06340 [Candidatus Taylorbacteria bacterium CG11_big_fil_rev_8_21_14_0_20_46_11]